MKKITLFLMIALALASCNQSAKKAENKIAEITADATVVNVFYFHGKQRCKTCVAVQNIAKETVEKLYADNEKVVFHEINTAEKANDALCEKYEISWNALIIAKGEDFIEITDQAFATALGNPQALENLIKEEISKRLAK
jgi:hypothetical protein